MLSDQSEESRKYLLYKSEKSPTEGSIDGIQGRDKICFI